MVESNESLPSLDESSETLHNLRKQVTDQRIGIIVSSPDALLRDGLVALIDQWEEFYLIKAVKSLTTARKLCIEAKASVCILDTSINEESLDITKSILEDAPLTRIIILSTSESNDNIIEALRAGIHGYCIRETIEANRVRGMIWGILSGAAMIYGLERSKLASSPQGKAAEDKRASAFESLSKREMEVLALLSQGLTNSEIGARLYLSDATVKKNISRIVTKLQVENRVQAAVLASRYMG